MDAGRSERGPRDRRLRRQKLLRGSEELESFCQALSKIIIRTYCQRHCLSSASNKALRDNTLPKSKTRRSDPRVARITSSL